MAANATHAYLIQIAGDQTATPQTIVRSVWTAPENTPLNISELDAEHFVSLEPWRDLLMQGQSIHGLVKDVLAFRQTPLWPSLNTVAIVPVFLEGEIWGVMGFGHSDLDHEWQVPEVDALRVAAGTFGAALLRWQNVKQRQAQERFLTTLADITQMSMQIPDIEAMLQALADRLRTSSTRTTVTSRCGTQKTGKAYRLPPQRACARPFRQPAADPRKNR